MVHHIEELALQCLRDLQVPDSSLSDLQFLAKSVRLRCRYNMEHHLLQKTQLLYETESIQTDKPKYIICKTGDRSRDAVELLEAEGFDQLYNVKGGIFAYADEIDAQLTKY